MDQKDKKEIAKMFGEVLEQNVLPVIDEIKTEISKVKEDVGEVKTEISKVKAELKKDISDVSEKVTRLGIKLDNSTFSSNEKFENHDKRILVLEGKK